MATKRIVVINPNSNRDFTAQMDRAVNFLRFDGAIEIDCMDLAGAPLGIETQRDIDSVIDPVCAAIEREAANVSAFVIACFADPGVQSAREVTEKPVLGTCEPGIATALNYGERYGVVSSSTAARNAEIRLIRSLGLEIRLVGLEPVDVPVVEILSSNETYDRMLGAGRRLKELGAEVLVLGCAGMIPFQEKLAQDLGIPVVDPVRAATAMAIGMGV